MSKGADGSGCLAIIFLGIVVFVLMDQFGLSLFDAIASVFLFGWFSFLFLCFCGVAVIVLILKMFTKP